MDIKEYTIENEKDIIQEFIETHEPEYKEYFRNSWDEGYRCDVHEDEDGIQYPYDDDLRREFCEEHPSYMRFIELRYADYMSGGE